MLDPIDHAGRTVKAARLPDAQVVGELWLRLAEETVRWHGSFRLAPDAGRLLAERVRDDLWDPTEDELYLLATDREREDAPVGFAAARVIEADPIFEDSLRCVLEGIWVAPEARRSGLGRVMLDAVARWCAGRGAKWIQAQVAEANAAGRAFFGAAGLEGIAVVITRRL